MLFAASQSFNIISVPQRNGVTEDSVPYFCSLVSGVADATSSELLWCPTLVMSGQPKADSCFYVQQMWQHIIFTIGSIGQMSLVPVVTSDLDVPCGLALCLWYPSIARQHFLRMSETPGASESLIASRELWPKH